MTKQQTDEKDDLGLSRGEPIETESEDKLGHSPAVQELANAILHRSPASGFVVGIEGPWGAGKSSIANLLVRRLGIAKPKATIIRFNPWLIGTRQQLLGELFADIIRAASKLTPMASRSRWRVDLRLFDWYRTKLLADSDVELLTLLADLAKRLGQIGALFVALGINGPAWVGLALIGIVGRQLRSSIRSRSLIETKNKINLKLRELPQRIIVLIDDMDRLEPAEAIEVLRLIRAVADFDNVTYVLCYDREVLADAVKSELRISDGGKFLEKIVQLPFLVPPPEAFRLRRWFSEEFSQVFATRVRSSQSGDDRDEVDRLAGAIDIYGGRYLKTPRSVVLTLNSLALYLPALAEKVDMGDLVWINLVRHGAPDLFAWIEGYLAEVSAVANGASISKSERDASAKQLLEIVAKNHTDLDHEMYRLAELIPGLVHAHFPEKGWKVFEDISRQDLQRFIQRGRIGSPDHHRIYFAMTQPEDSIPTPEVSTFASNLENDGVAAKHQFQKASEQLIGGQITRAERLVDQTFASGKLSPKQLGDLVKCLADSLDEASRRVPPLPLLGQSFWRRGEQIVRDTLPILAPSVRINLIGEIFRSGNAIGFLTHVVRRETFDHGLHGNDKKPEQDWMLTASEFEEIATVLRNRFINMPLAEFLQIPELLSLLFGWSQLGGAAEAKDKVAEVVRSDGDLLIFLSACRGWTSRSSTRQRTVILHPLKRRELDKFLDVGLILIRLSEIAKKASTDVQRAWALELVDAFGHGDAH